MTSGTSRLNTASKARRPMPGQPKIVSTMTEPPSSELTCRPAMVTMGSSALRAAWCQTMRHRPKPLLRAVRTWSMGSTSSMAARIRRV